MEWISNLTLRFIIGVITHPLGLQVNRFRKLEPVLFECDIPNLQRVDIPKDEEIRVRPGDVIGVQYYRKDGLGVVPYEQSDLPITAGVDHDQLSKIFNEYVADSSVPVGAVKTVAIGDVKRLPALKPILA